MSRDDGHWWVRHRSVDVWWVRGPESASDYIYIYVYIHAWTKIAAECMEYMRHASTHAATGVASDIYRCSGEGAMLLAFLFDCIFDGFFDGRNKKRFIASDVTRFLGFLFFFLHRRQLALVI